MKFKDEGRIEDTRLRKEKDKRRKTYMGVCRDTKQHKNGVQLSFLDFRDRVRA
jgi:hypothetical protein